MLSFRGTWSARAGESVLLAAIGGALGLLIAYPFVERGLGRFIEENMGTSSRISG